MWCVAWMTLIFMLFVQFLEQVKIRMCACYSYGLNDMNDIMKHHDQHTCIIIVHNYYSRPNWRASWESEILTTTRHSGLVTLMLPSLQRYSYFWKLKQAKYGSVVSDLLILCEIVTYCFILCHTLLSICAFSRQVYYQKSIHFDLDINRVIECGRKFFFNINLFMSTLLYYMW